MWLQRWKVFTICCMFPGRHSSAGFRRREQGSGRAGEWTMFILERPAQDCAAATATVQAEWSASVMRDTMVGHKQHITYTHIHLLHWGITVHKHCKTICDNSAQWLFVQHHSSGGSVIVILSVSSPPLCIFRPEQVTIARSPAATCPAPSRTTLSLAVCLRRAGSWSKAAE